MSSYVHWLYFFEKSSDDVLLVISEPCGCLFNFIAYMIACTSIAPFSELFFSEVNANQSNFASDSQRKVIIQVLKERIDQSAILYKGLGRAW